MRTVYVRLKEFNKGDIVQTLVVDGSRDRIMLDVDKDQNILGVEVVDYKFIRVGGASIRNETE